MFLLRPQTSDAERVRTRMRPHDGVRMDGREWKYVAEGGANVLFRHQPPSSSAELTPTESQFYGKLLRVKKCDAEKATQPKKLRKKCSKARSVRSIHARSSSLGSDADDVVVPTEPYNAHYPRPSKVVEYATNDVLPYLEKQVRGNEYEQVAQLLHVEQRFLGELNEQLLTLESRPKHRRQSQIDVSQKCVMVLPDVTLPPPDEDPLLYFDETIDSEDGSESGSSTEKNPAEQDLGSSSISGREGAGGDASTDPTTDVDLFDALAEEIDTALDEATRSPSSSSTVTSGDPDMIDADGSADEIVDDEDDDEDEETGPPIPQRRRMLSGNCNIFDCCFRNICAEFKPKIGFKPKGKLIADVRKRVCRFCMHQHYKRATGKVEEISEYCPLDLFSRDPDRIRRALRSLQRTPQNNFKVFVRSSNDDVVNVITGLGTDALPKGVAQTRYSCRRKRQGFRHSCRSIGTENDLLLQDESERLLPDVVELLVDVLLKLHILEDLKKIQLLDHISVDGMWHLHKLLERTQEIANENKDLTLSSLVESIRKSVPADKAGNEADELREGSLARCLAFLEVAIEEVPDMDVVQALQGGWDAMSLSQFESFYDQLLQRFQVATTLKDCSLLLCLRRAVDDGVQPAPTTTLAAMQHHPQCLTKSSPRLLPLNAPRKTFDHLREYEHRIEFRDMVFNCVIAIVDLDVKSHKSVDDYYRLDEKIVQHYVRTFGEKLQADACLED